MPRPLHGLENEPALQREPPSARAHRFGKAHMAIVRR
jgi:hypothetical protein